MYLDEKLVQMELKRNAKPDDNEAAEKLKEEILRQEQEQPPVADFISALSKGTVNLKGNDQACETQSFLDGNAHLFVFPDDVETIWQRDNMTSIIYKTLDIGANLMYTNAPLAVKNEKEYQQKMKEQLKKDGLLYCPLNAGRLNSGRTRIFYATGITTSKVGGIFVVHFYYKYKATIVMGSLTCKLMDRFFYENLFLAMLHLICEEEE